MVDYERFLLFKEVRRAREKKQRKKKLILVRRAALLEWGARNESKKEGTARGLSLWLRSFLK